MSTVPFRSISALALVILLILQQAKFMALDRNLQYIISTASRVGDFDTALPWLEALNNDQIVELILPDHCTPLHYACQHGRIDVAQRLITNCQYSIESKDVQGCTPLHTAAQYGQVETLKYLLHRLFDHEVPGLTVELTPGGKLSHTLTSMFQQMLSDRHRDQSGNTPLHTACVHGQLDIVQLLTHKIGCDPNNTNNEGLSSLHLAAQHGHLSLIRYLVEEVGNDVTLEDEHARSPSYLAGHLDTLKCMIEEKRAGLQLRTSTEWKTAQFIVTLMYTASWNGHLHVVRYLVEHHGCDPSCKDDEGITPLHLACQEGHLDIVSYLITEAHCDLNCTSQDGMTCLHAASIGGSLDVIKYLHINHSCHMQCDSHGRTPLHSSAALGNLHVLMYLIEHMGSDPNATAEFGETPLHCASQGGHLEIVKYLVNKHYCDPLCPNINAITPLHRAAASGQLEVVRYFAITQGRTLLVKDEFGSTPLHLAALKGHLHLVEFLTEDMKCDPLLKGQHEGTPLHYASKSGHLNVVKYLVDTHHCNPLAPDLFQNTPLHCASVCGQLAVVRYFTAALNCSILVKNIYNNTPLNVAASNGHLDVVKFLIEDLNCDPSILGRSYMTPLHLSLRNKHFEVAMYLIGLPNCTVAAKNYHINQPTNPLHLAVKTQNFEIVSYLCNTRRLDPHLQPEKEKLLEAAENPAVFEFLENYTDPLHFAAVYGDLETVKHYVEREKWDPMKEDRFGNNTLHNAALHGQLEVVKFLTGLNKDPIDNRVEILCNPIVKDKYGLTAQDIASQNGHRHVVSYLLRASFNRPVLQQDALSPPFNILIIGNSGSGKSTLVKALTVEKRRLGRITKVRGVIPQTAGIVLTTLHSQMYGEVNIYDFAGHEEYYASHEMILQQTAQPLVLLVVNISLSKETIKMQILYWLSILSNSSSKDVMKTIHLLAVMLIKSSLKRNLTSTV